MKTHRIDRATLVQGDSREVLAKFGDNRFDSVVTDPPYELGFMGKSWDSTGIANSVELWREVYRVLKPGGHVLAFGGTRTYHRMACAIEDAGFEIRDSLHWLYGTGFPKSLDVSKAIDATERFGGSGSQNLRARDGNEIGTVGSNMATHRSGANDVRGASAGVTSDLAKQWSGWGTALKPAHEPIIMARKPLIGTVAQNVAAHGTGALNIDACRIESADSQTTAHANSGSKGLNALGRSEKYNSESHALGRWPANILLDEHAAAELDRQSGQSKSTPSQRNNSARPVTVAKGAESARPSFGHADSGGASRFFYVSKPSRAERDRGCDHLPEHSAGEATDRADGSAGLDNPRAGAGRTGGARNNHPTVKPVELMRYLVRLITPPSGIVLDPFAGSGTTGIAAKLEGFDFFGVDLSAEYLEIAKARIAGAA